MNIEDFGQKIRKLLKAKIAKRNGLQYLEYREE